jgi:beta-mannosidase
LWRPVWFTAGEVAFDVCARLGGHEGIVTVRTGLPEGTRVRIGDVSAIVTGGRAELRLPSPTLWWPHTHGEPHLYEVTVDGYDISRRIGFRTVTSPGDILRDGLRPQINGIDVFVRGALWTPVPQGEMRSTLETARDHGLNAVRIPGTMTYETPAFHDLCDELGILVWQDLMFANMDYPLDDPDFRALVGEELDALIGVIGGRPSTFCVCGGSEIEQQVAMLGLDPALGRPSFFAEEVPAVLAEAEVEALYVPSAPCGADRPLLPSQGVSNWFGVGGYLRPFSEIRSAGVRFASECLAIANVRDDVPHANDPAWKQGVPKDAGTDWDFDDVRDHYLKLLYEVDPKELRASDPKRYLDLSKAVSGDVMAEVFGEWRRPESGCGGGFVLWLRDLVRGAGWGLIDSDGQPKPVLRALSNVLAPVAIWMTDEGMGGYGVHVANDRPEALNATIIIGLIRSGKRVDGGESPITVLPRSAWSGDAETIIGRWVDIAYTYRFGAPAHDLVTAELRSEAGDLLGTARRYPLGRARAA